jgi:hypothetical protein
MSEFVEAAECEKCKGPLVRKENIFRLRGRRKVHDDLGVSTFDRGGDGYPGLCCEECVRVHPTKEWIDALDAKK